MEIEQILSQLRTKKTSLGYWAVVAHAFKPCLEKQNKNP